MEDKNRKDVGLGLDAVCTCKSLIIRSWTPKPSERRFKSHWPLNHRPLSPHQQTNRRKKHTATVRLFVHGFRLGGDCRRATLSQRSSACPQPKQVDSARAKMSSSSSEKRHAQPSKLRELDSVVNAHTRTQRLTSTLRCAAGDPCAVHVPPKDK